MLDLEDNHILMDFHGLNLLPGDLGLDESDVPDDHPDKAEFIFDRLPLLKGPYDLVF